MPVRSLIAKELSTLFGVFSHPDRIRIVEELRSGELDVNALQAVLGVSHSRTSQNLSVLRMYRIVAERREGRHVYYRLIQPEMATWIYDGLRFLQGEADYAQQRLNAVEEVKLIWKTDQPIDR